MGGQAGPGTAARADGLVDESRVYFRIPGKTRDEVLQEIAERLVALHLIPDASDLVARLLDRERLGCTGLGGGIAIPHCKLPGIDRVAVAVATTEQPVDFGAADGKPIRLIFLVVSPTQGAAAHLQALARVSRMLRVPGVAQRLREAAGSEQLHEALREAEAGLPQAVSQ